MKKFFLAVLSLAFTFLFCSCSVSHCVVCGENTEDEMDKSEVLRSVNAWISDYETIPWYYKTSNLIDLADNVKEIKEKVYNVDKKQLYICSECRRKINQELPTAHMCDKCGAQNSYNKSYDWIYCDKCYDEIVKEDTRKLLEFSNLSSNSNSAYNVVTGSVTNNGNHTVYFVKVKITYTDNQHNVIDTDTAYVCGEEGLAVGETSKFYSSVIKDSRFAYYKVEIYDWWDNL